MGRSTPHSPLDETETRNQAPSPISHATLFLELQIEWIFGILPHAGFRAEFFAQSEQKTEIMEELTGSFKLLKLSVTELFKNNKSKLPNHICK
jgi:hypothetical protein